MWGKGQVDMLCALGHTCTWRGGNMDILESYSTNIRERLLSTLNKGEVEVKLTHLVSYSQQIWGLDQINNLVPQSQ